MYGFLRFADTGDPLMRHPHKWEDLLPEEFYAELERRPLVYWACGAMEEHGLHNALGVDPYMGYEICQRAVAMSGGILFPLVPFAPAWVPARSRSQLRRDYPELFPPSLWTSRELCELLYVELMESMADVGFEACIAFGGHWPAEALLAELEERYEGQIVNMKFRTWGIWGALKDVIEEEVKQNPNMDGHGMMWETSMVAALRPEWVELERAARIKQSPLPSQLKDKPDESIAEIANANSALGERLLSTAARRLADLGTDMLQA